MVSLALLGGCGSHPAASPDMAVGAADAAVLSDAGTMGTDASLIVDLGADPCSQAPPASGPDLGLNEPASFCGTSLGAGAEPNSLYRCMSGVTVSKTPCEFGCRPAPPTSQTMGLESRDYCALRLPFACGSKVDCTQSNFGEGCGATYDHQYWPEQFAWDFGDVTRGVTLIAAARSGTIVAIIAESPPGKTYASDGGVYECYNGCGAGAVSLNDCCKTCLYHSNHVKIDHGDGTITTYAHLDSIDPKWKVGDLIKAGEAIGPAGTSGCSTGPHLHFMSMRDTNDRRPDGTLRTYDCKASTYECSSLPASFVDVAANMGNPPCSVSAANLSPTPASGCN